MSMEWIERHVNGLPCVCPTVEHVHYASAPIEQSRLDETTATFWSNCMEICVALAHSPPARSKCLTLEGWGLPGICWLRLWVRSDNDANWKERVLINAVHSLTSRGHRTFWELCGCRLAQ